MLKRKEDKVYKMIYSIEFFSLLADWVHLKENSSQAGMVFKCCSHEPHDRLPKVNIIGEAGERVSVGECRRETS